MSSSQPRLLEEPEAGREGRLAKSMARRPPISENPRAESGMREIT